MTVNPDLTALKTEREGVGKGGLKEWQLQHDNFRMLRYNRQYNITSLPRLVITSLSIFPQFVGATWRSRGLSALAGPYGHPVR